MQQPQGSEPALYTSDRMTRLRSLHELMKQARKTLDFDSAGLLLTIAVRRKIKRREFRVVHELLEVGCALGLTNGPVSSQAAEMLERLATFANITCSQRSEAVP